MRLIDLLKEEKELMAEQTEVNACSKSEKNKPEEDENIYREKAEPAKGPVEYYDADCVEYKLMHYKPQEYDYLNVPLENCALRIKQIRRRLRAVRFISRSIIFAYETSNRTTIAWGEPRMTKFGKEERFSRSLDAEIKRISWTEKIARSV